MIPKGTAVILKATAAPIEMALTTTAPAAGAYDGNQLKGVDYDTPQAANTSYYVLSKPQKGINIVNGKKILF